MSLSVSGPYVSTSINLPEHPQGAFATSPLPATILSRSQDPHWPKIRKIAGRKYDMRKTARIFTRCLVYVQFRCLSERVCRLQTIPSVLRSPTKTNLRWEFPPKDVRCTFCRKAG